MSIDSETKQKIEPFLTRCEVDIDRGAITKEELINCIVCAESSEYNDIFVYLMNTIKDVSREIIPAVVKIQQHKENVIRFLESKPEYKELLARLKKTPNTWREKILVVDDSEVIVELLKEILANEGIVEGAENGKEALEKISKGYYAAIISDVDMPLMNGIEFYKSAVQIYLSYR